MSHLRFWKYEVDGQGNVILQLDCGAETRQNVLKQAVLKELEEVVDGLTLAVRGKFSKVNALIIASAKPDSFCAGADINEIREYLDKPGEVAFFLRQIHSIFLKIHNAPFPIVAAVSGECLGGGLELAMVCHGRVAADMPRTRFALPEVSLGIIPGFGGTQMLPRLVGLPKALEVIVGQKKLSVRDAWKCGLVDHLVPADKLLAEAKFFAEVARERNLNRQVSQGVEKIPIFGRRLVLAAARKRVLKETRGNYPSPLLALKAVESSNGDLESGLAREGSLFVECLKTPEARNLMSVFFLRKEARSRKWVDHPAVECPKCVGVLGAGVMGRGIAYAVLSANVPVVLYDPYPQAVASAVVFVEQQLAKEVKRGKLALEQAMKRRNLLTVTWGESLRPLAKTDFVIEAVLENLEVKHKVLAELDKQLARDAVVATNTSSLLPSDIVKGFPRPEYFCAMHFFNPAHVMDLVEIAGHPGTAPYAIAKTLALTKAMGKTPLVLKKECPGLIVNRVLIQYLAWGFYAASDGTDPWKLDEAFEKFGMMMGPLKTLDLVGFDIGKHVIDLMADYYPGHLIRSAALPNLLGDKTVLGQKTGKGFYFWQNNKAVRPNPDILKTLKLPGQEKDSVAPACQKIMDCMLKEAGDLIAEGVTDAWVIDLSMILGAGFPPAKRGLLGKD